MSAARHTPRVACVKPDCDCYPFVCVKCNYCKVLWYYHNKGGYLPSGLCSECLYIEQKETNKTLCELEKAEVMELDTKNSRSCGCMKLEVG